MSVPSASTVTKSVAGAVDSIPIDRLAVIDASDIGDVVSDASDFVTDSAVVLGVAGAEVAAKSARVAWRNRSTLATAVILGLAIVGVIAIWRSRQDPTGDPDIA